MHPAELAILLHHALEVRLALVQEHLQRPDWSQDPEGLHQVRVTGRRLGAVLDLVDPAAYPGHKGHRRTLKQLVKALGPIRELDVHVAALQAQQQATHTPLQAASLEYLLERLDRARERAHKVLHKELATLPLQDLRKLLRVPSLPHPFQAVSLQEAAWTTLAPQGLILGVLPALAQREDAAALHKARVRLKGLRYGIEALEGAFSEPPSALLGPLRDLQSHLGTHHDLAALEAWLWEAEAHLRSHDWPVLCGGVLDVLGVIAENRRAAFDTFAATAQNPALAGLLTSLRRGLGLPSSPADA